MLSSYTPIEQYTVSGRKLYVKREDCCIDGPSFSKLRGVAAHIRNRKEHVIGVLDTFHSRAGWGTALLCQEMGRKAVVFYPVYKNDMLIRGNQLNARKLGAELRGLTAGRSCILYHRAKAQLASFSDSYMLPNALKCPETVEETAREVLTVPRKFFKDTLWVVSVSSGTIAAGVLRGMVMVGAQGRMLLHLGYSRPETAVIDYVVSAAGGSEGVKLTVVDEGYEYKNGLHVPCPFPCNVYYDRKAWFWLQCHAHTVPERNILFWNIGA